MCALLSIYFDGTTVCYQADISRIFVKSTKVQVEAFGVFNIVNKTNSGQNFDSWNHFLAKKKRTIFNKDIVDKNYPAQKNHQNHTFYHKNTHILVL